MKRQHDLVEPNDLSPTVDVDPSSAYTSQWIDVKKSNSFMTTMTLEDIANFEDMNAEDDYKRTTILTEVARVIVFLDRTSQAIVLDKIVERIEIEPCSDLTTMALHVLGKYMAFPYVDGVALLHLLIDYIPKTNSTRVRAKVYGLIAALVSCRQVIHDQQSQNKMNDLLTNAKRDVYDCHFCIRCECLTLLSILPTVFERQALSKHSSSSVWMHKDHQNIIKTFLTDPCPQVRVSALKALVAMRARGYILEKELYGLAADSLKDEDEQVRLVALDLIRLLSALYSKTMVLVSPENQVAALHHKERTQIRLIDDAFARVCDLINDLSVDVRTKACTMLRSFRDVDSGVLQQAFSKQIIMRSKVRKPALTGPPTYTHRKPVVASGDRTLSSEDFRISESGACGAFIHGLEDEFPKVVNAAIDSICELCMYHPALVPKAAESLVDMFNEEFVLVRTNAINSLRKLATKTKVTLTAEQLIVSAGVLEDGVKTVRECMLDMLKVVHIGNQEDILLLLSYFMRNHTGFPDDELAILRAARHIGLNHCQLIETMVPQLLNFNMRFLAREPNVRDFSYTLNCILVANACSRKPGILKGLPSFTMNHFHYYERKYDGCVPNFKGIDILSCANVTGKGNMPFRTPDISFFRIGHTVTQQIDSFMKGSVDLMSLVYQSAASSDFSACQDHINKAETRFSRITELESRHAHVAHFAMLYLQGYKIALKANNVLTSGNAFDTLSDAATLLKIAYKMQYAFFGQSSGTLEAIHQFKLFAHWLWCFGAMKDTSLSSSKLVTPGTFMSLVARIDTIQSHISNTCSYFDTLTSLRKTLITYPSDQTVSNLSKIQMTIKSLVPIPIDLTQLVKRLWATIHAPVTNPDKPQRFHAMFPVDIKVDAKITQAFDLSRIGVQIILADHTHVYHWPRPNEFIPVSPGTKRLSTTISLPSSNVQKNEPIQIAIVRSFDPELPGIDHILSTPPTSTTQPSADILKLTAPLNQTSAVVVSDSVAMYFKS
ncbi:hypothetical protein DM01DRAFT_1332815 [Hesseltinella vesiculosa]|uniref:ARM repeat-containing protein n=1 Tax=Hesseltinella vesiculosa TaxID=101127 RepID=A0A1X2GT95_9FUNG|nr:hypothetical protein DM01DRAFT_1332815 [Hesseltinella vesiculosa]